ncbi:cupin domain-containing protein [Amycolatopsis sp. NPDC049691]|uniref:cupin domain-containing protein n=1 Tax=Amycolatopsis sp. NPDC049691 TaxID=3155155 RepID=UPI00342254BC
MESDDSRNVFDVPAEMAALPATATTMLVDKYFVDKPSASARIFRIYREVPLHYHEECDEHLSLLSGGGTFHLDGAEFEARPGMFLCFDRRKVHGFPKITSEPLVVLAIDVPRRRPDDIVFVDPSEGDAKTFMARNA